MKKNIFIITFLFLLVNIKLNAQEISKVAVFGVPQKYPMLNALTIESVKLCSEYFEELGRFVPVPPREIDQAAKKAQSVSNSIEYFKKTAKILNADIFVIIAVFQRNNTIHGEMKIFSLNKKYIKLQKSVNVKTKIKNNIPLLLAREVIKSHEKLTIWANIRNIKNNDLVVLNAGQWHGLEKDKYNIVDSGSIEILQANFYTSFGKIKNNKKRIIEIELYPDIADNIDQIDSTIEENILEKYSIENNQLKGLDAEKKLLEGLCIINPGSNICLPAYGSFLSTYHLGFKSAEPSYYGLWATAIFLTTQIMAVPVATEFKSNFFPWKQDSDKNNSMKSLHVFLWASIPFTISSSYLDQLSYQFHDKKVLPPMFENRNSMAGFLSVLIPGGGMFYKGYRIIGWGFYTTEMGLASYAMYNRDEKNGKYAFAALGAIKALEVFASIVIGPSYKVFRDENYIDSTTDVSFGINSDYNNRGTKYSYSILKKF